MFVCACCDSCCAYPARQNSFNLVRRCQSRMLTRSQVSVSTGLQQTFNLFHSPKPFSLSLQFHSKKTITHDRCKVSFSSKLYSVSVSVIRKDATQYRALPAHMASRIKQLFTPKMLLNPDRIEQHPRCQELLDARVTGS